METTQRGIDLDFAGSVAVVRWHDGENRFNESTLSRWHTVLDELEAVEGPLAVVITGDGKFFSNGLDLEALAASPSSVDAVVAGLHRLFGRLLLFPAYTVGALNGHSFAAGAMMASCFDYRIMREDRGYWCLPEADLGLPLTPGMFAAVTARLPVAAAAEAMNTARRYTATEAMAAGLVDELGPFDGLVDLAIQKAEAVAGKDRRVIAEHKRLLFGEAARACGYSREDVPPE